MTHRDLEDVQEDIMNPFSLCSRDVSLFLLRKVHIHKLNVSTGTRVLFVRACMSNPHIYFSGMLKELTMAPKTENYMLISLWGTSAFHIRYFSGHGWVTFHSRFFY